MDELHVDIPWQDQDLETLLERKGAELQSIRNGGTLLVYGVARDDARLALSPYEMFRRELTVLWSFAEMTSFAAALNARGVPTARSGGWAAMTVKRALDRAG